MIEGQKKNILFSVHEISPILGSECSSGWNIVMHLSKFHNLTVLFATTNQFQTQNYNDQIKSYLKQNKLDNKLISFIPISQPKVGLFISGINKLISSKKSSTGFSFLYFIAYRLWQIEVYKKAKHLRVLNSYDIVHHFNALSFREPGYLYKLNIPFFWGPTSGLDNLPAAFMDNVPLPMRISMLIRNWANLFQFKFSKRVTDAAKKAVRIYAVTKEDKLKLSLKSSCVENLLDVGTDLGNSPKLKKQSESLDKIKLLWVGRLDYLKALDILLYAIYDSDLIRSKTEIFVVGTGPQEMFYKMIAKSLNIDNIKWVGHISKIEVENMMKDSNLLIHTSIKEAGSAVVLESLSSGLPVICHDAFGMSHAITDRCGVKVPFISRDKSIQGFKNAIESLVKNPSNIWSMSIASIERAQELSWNAIATKISDDYNKISFEKCLN